MRSRRLMRSSLGRAVLSLLWLSVSMAECTRHAQFRRPRLRACSPSRSAGAFCPDRLPLVLAFAHLDRAPAQHARITVYAPARCRSRDTVILACSIAVAAWSLMPTHRQRRLVMLWLHLQRFRSCSPRRGAGAVCSVRCRALSRTPALAQPALAVDADRGEQDRGDFTRQNLLQWHHVLLGGAAEAQLVGPRGVLASLAACLNGNRHAACSVSAAAPAHMLTHTDRRRCMP
jgi:hypothetical protein